MSIDRNMHLGPYAECVYKTGEQRTETRKGCDNSKCKRARQEVLDGSRFCSACGGEIGHFEVKVALRPDVMDLTDEALCRTLTDKRRTIVIANVHRKGAPKRTTDADQEEAIDLGAVDRDAERAWFERAFAPELSKLRVAFASVEVKWGLLKWFS